MRFAWVVPPVVSIVIAETDSLSGGAGWVGAGLLGAVLAWLMFVHLPSKDKQIEKLIDNKDKQFEALVLAKDMALKASNEAHVLAMDRVVQNCEEESRLEREAGERRFHEGMSILRQIHDTTQRLSQEMRLRTRLTDAMQSAEVPIWVKNLDGTVLSWNRAAEEMFGWTQGETVGYSIYNRIIPPDKRQEEESILLRLAAGEKIEEYETDRMSKRGTRVRVWLSTSPIRDVNGRVVGATSIARHVDMP